MKRSFYFLLGLLSLLSPSKAQEQVHSASSQPDRIVRLHILAPGITVENTIGYKRTFLYDFTLGFSYEYSNINGYVSTSGDIVPQARLEWRKYTSLSKREHRGKRTDHYSSQYWATQLIGGYSINMESALISFGGLWGFQTAFAKSAYFDIGIGFGVGTDFQAVGLVPVGNFALGWIIE